MEIAKKILESIGLLFVICLMAIPALSMIAIAVIADVWQKDNHI